MVQYFEKDTDNASSEQNRKQIKVFGMLRLTPGSAEAVQRLSTQRKRKQASIQYPLINVEAAALDKGCLNILHRRISYFSSF